MTGPRTTLTGPENYRARIQELDQRIGDLYRERRQVMEAFAEAEGPAVLPERTRQTDVQKLVARCPRCGGSYSIEET